MSDQLLTVVTNSSAPLTVRHVLMESGKFLSQCQIETARLDAELMLALALRQDREGLYRRLDAVLRDDEIDRFQGLLDRRSRHEPVAYITGRREFWSLELSVTPDVLIPRPETELVVEVALELMGQFESEDGNLQILDLGTGSGNIAISLAKERTDLEVCATDISNSAVKVAKENARRHGLEKRIRFLTGDAFDAVRESRGFFHLIVTNPPYVRSSGVLALPRDVCDWEPALALDGGTDGLDLYRRIANEGYGYLKAGGFLVTEIGDGMGQDVLRLIDHAGAYSTRSLRHDYSGRERVIFAKKT